MSIWCGTRVILNLVGLSALIHPLFIRSREGPQPSIVAFLPGSLPSARRVGRGVLDQGVGRPNRRALMPRRSELCILAMSLPAAVGLHHGLRRLLSWLRRPRSRIVVKLGGSACTDKAAFETVHAERLQVTASQLAQTRPAGGEDRVLLHGAGSFGHFQARQYGLKHGATHPGYAPIGFALTRSSVTRLNSLVLSSLLQCGLPAVSLAAFPRWRKRHNVMGSGAALCADVARAWRAGLLPVLHGDAVFDERQVRRCTGACGTSCAFVHLCIGAHWCIGALVYCCTVHWCIATHYYVVLL